MTSFTFSIGRLLTYISDVIDVGRGEVFVLGLMSSNLVRSVVSCRVSMQDESIGCHCFRLSGSARELL